MSSKTINSNLPSISLDGGFSKYLMEIKKFPMLSADEEYMLAKSWKDRGDIKSAQKLITSHLRLVAKMAMGYRGYGLTVSELVSEGNIGLMQAVKKFQPEKGFRLATYAMWWIKASIQEYVLRSWSLVKMGTTTAQKKLFFNLKKIKNKLSITGDGDLKPDQVKEISKRLNVKQEEVISMDRRMSGKEKSLNDPIKSENATEWQDANWAREKGLYAEVFEDVGAMDQAIDELVKKLEPLGLASTSRTGVVAMTKGPEIYKQH